MQGRPPVPSSYYGDGDVSPPDSPIQDQTRNSGDVSPIESDIQKDIHPAFRIAQQKKPSGIPVARKSSQNLYSPQRAYNRDPSKPTRWDKYSGEPTSSAKGLTHGVAPENVLQTLEQIKLRKASNGDTQRIPRREVSQEVKPPWKGGSGRIALVEPVQDKPGQRVPIPRRPVGSLSPIVTSPAMSSGSVHEHLIPSPKSTVADVSGSHTPSDTIRPDPMASSLSVASAHSQHSQLSNRGQSMIDETRQLINNSNDILRRAQLAMSNVPEPPRTPTNAEEFDSSEMETPTPNGKNTNSRFSWTTQGTNATYQQSPQSIAGTAPPMPEIPAHLSVTSAALSDSIMNRKRPIPKADDYSPGSGSPLTPTAPAFPAFRKASSGLKPESREISSRKPSYASSIQSTSTGGGKALPPTPQELNSQDHVSSLQAQLQDLMTQRRNVERVLRDLTAPGASNPLVSSFRVEREREKRVQALRDELNEIGLMEHHIGLKLHRAQRKREEEDGYEGFATMWVRRVTS